MTNNEFNEGVLAEISKKLAEIEELKKTLKPADVLPEVTLAMCNAGAREAHFAKYAAEERLQKALAMVAAEEEKTPEEVKPKRKRRNTIDDEDEE